MAKKKSEVVLLFCFSLIIDREGSKSQLRHTEPPREKRKRKINGQRKKIKMWGEKRNEKKRKRSVQRFLCNICSTLHSSKNNNNLLCDLFIHFSIYFFFSFFSLSLREATRTRLSQLSNNTGTGSHVWSITKHHRPLHRRLLLLVLLKTPPCHHVCIYTHIHTHTPLIGIVFKPYKISMYIFSIRWPFCYKIGLEQWLTFTFKFTFFPHVCPKSPCPRKRLTTEHRGVVTRVLVVTVLSEVALGVKKWRQNNEK